MAINTEPASFRHELKQRGVSAWEAYKCCVYSRNVATRYISEISNRVLEMWDGRGQTRESAVFPWVPVLTLLLMQPKRIRTAPRPAPPGPGVVITFILVTYFGDPLEWREDGKWEQPFGWAEAFQVAQPLQAAERALRKRTDGDCLRCIQSKLWTQKKLRRTVTILSSTNLKSKSGTRSIGDRKLNLRTPHR